MLTAITNPSTDTGAGRCAPSRSVLYFVRGYSAKTERTFDGLRPFATQPHIVPGAISSDDDLQAALRRIDLSLVSPYGDDVEHLIDSGYLTRVVGNRLEVLVLDPDVELYVPGGWALFDAKQGVILGVGDTDDDAMDDAVAAGLYDEDWETVPYFEGDTDVTCLVEINRRTRRLFEQDALDGRPLSVERVGDGEYLLTDDDL